jgi:hypothetical protein
MGTEASWKRRGLEQQSSGHGTTSRIRTEAASTSAKAMPAKTLQIALHSLRHLCQGQASLVRRNGGSEALQMPFRAYHRPMIV